MISKKRCKVYIIENPDKIKGILTGRKSQKYKNLVGHIKGKKRPNEMSFKKRD